MDLEKLNGYITDAAEYQAMQEELIADLKRQAEDEGLALLSTQPNVFRFGAVLTDAFETRWVHVTIDDVSKEQFWAQNVNLRRMSSERDWKGEEFHHCAWHEVGAKAKELMSAEYDSEIL